MNIDRVYSTDHFVRAGETLSSKSMNTFSGGKGLNQSVALARAGAKVIHGGILGDDGDFLLEAMKQSGVDTSRIARESGSCGHAVIQVDKSGQNSILLFAGTNHSITEEYVRQFLADAVEGDILLIQNEINGLDFIFEIAHRKQMQIAFNPSPFDSSILNLPLEYVDWWFCNELEGEQLFGSDVPREICDNFLKMYPESNLILTLGKNGSIFVNAEHWIEQPIVPVQVVDTTAAGDTFTGYFLSSVIKGESIEQALQLATRASAITVSRPGASSIPFIGELTDK